MNDGQRTDIKPINCDDDLLKERLQHIPARQDERTHSERCIRDSLVEFPACQEIVLTGLGEGPDTLHDTPELVSLPENVFDMLVEGIFIFLFISLLCTLLRVALL